MFTVTALIQVPPPPQLPGLTGHGHPTAPSSSFSQKVGDETCRLKEISAPRVSCTLGLSAQEPGLAPLPSESQAEATKACTALSVPQQQVRRRTLSPFTLTLATGCRL